MGKMRLIYLLISVIVLIIFAYPIYQFSSFWLQSILHNGYITATASAIASIGLVSLIEGIIITYMKSVRNIVIANIAFASMSILASHNPYIDYLTQSAVMSYYKMSPELAELNKIISNSSLNSTPEEKALLSKVLAGKELSIATDATNSLMEQLHYPEKTKINNKTMVGVNAEQNATASISLNPQFGFIKSFELIAVAKRVITIENNSTINITSEEELSTALNKNIELKSNTSEPSVKTKEIPIYVEPTYISSKSPSFIIQNLSEENNITTAYIEVADLAFNSNQTNSQNSSQKLAPQILITNELSSDANNTNETMIISVALNVNSVLTSTMRFGYGAITTIALVLILLSINYSIWILYRLYKNNALTITPDMHTYGTPKSKDEALTQALNKITHKLLNVVSAYQRKLDNRTYWFIFTIFTIFTLAVVAIYVNSEHTVYISDSGSYFARTSELTQKLIDGKFLEYVQLLFASSMSDYFYLPFIPLSIVEYILNDTSRLIYIALTLLLYTIPIVLIYTRFIKNFVNNVSRETYDTTLSTAGAMMIAIIVFWLYPHNILIVLNGFVGTFIIILYALILVLYFDDRHNIIPTYRKTKIAVEEAIDKLVRTTNVSRETLTEVMKEKNLAVELPHQKTVWLTMLVGDKTLLNTSKMIVNKWITIGILLGVMMMFRRWFIFLLIVTIFCMVLELIVTFIAEIMSHKVHDKTRKVHIGELVHTHYKFVKLAVIGLSMLAFIFVLYIGKLSLMLNTNYADMLVAYQPPPFSQSVYNTVIKFGWIPLLLGAFGAIMLIMQGFVYIGATLLICDIFTPLVFLKYQYIAVQHDALIAAPIMIGAVVMISYAGIYIKRTRNDITRIVTLSFLAFIVVWGLGRFYFEDGDIKIASMLPQFRELPEQRKDIPELLKVNDFINHAKENNGTVYILSNHYKYSPYVLKRIDYSLEISNEPNKKWVLETKDNDKTTFLPISLLTAKYVIVATPYEKTNNNHVLTVPADMFINTNNTNNTNENNIASAFKTVDTLRFKAYNDNITITMFKRTRPNTASEIVKLIEAISHTSQ